MKGSNIAVFIDRDGTINEEVDYLNDMAQLHIFPYAASSIALLNKGGIKAVVITNQAGVARGHLSEEFLFKLHNKIKEEFSANGAYLDGIYYCPHHPQFGDERYRKVCECRKPNIGMLKTASADLHINIFKSYVIGDKLTDIELAHNAGCKGVLVLTGYGKLEQGQIKKNNIPHYIAGDLAVAVEWILNDININKKSN